MRDYDKEIKELQEKIAEIRTEQEKERIKDIPDIVGKYYSPASTVFLKVTEVTDYDKDFNEASVDCMSVYLDSGNYNASISTDSHYDVRLDCEISEEKFKNAYKGAFAIIDNLI